MFVFSHLIISLNKLSLCYLLWAASFSLLCLISALFPSLGWSVPAAQPKGRSHVPSPPPPSSQLQASLLFVRITNSTCPGSQWASQKADSCVYCMSSKLIPVLDTRINIWMYMHIYNMYTYSHSQTCSCCSWLFGYHHKYFYLSFSRAECEKLRACFLI